MRRKVESVLAPLWVGGWLMGLAILFGPAACSVAVGDSCETSNECGLNRTCDLSSPDGYCTMTPCEPDSCPEEAVCVEFESGATYCMYRCDDGSDCRDEYACVELEGSASPFCAPARQTAIGAPCLLNSDCGAGRICDLSLPGGYCTILKCGDELLCPEGSVCGVDFGEAKCLEACVSDLDCRTDYACYVQGGCLPAQGGRVGARCDIDGDCAEGLACDEALPGGLCTIMGCDGIQCPAGSACVGGGEESRCVALCVDFGECRPDYACVALTEGGECGAGGCGCVPESLSF